MVVGIGGVSRAGKSTLSNLLKVQLEKHGLSVAIVRQDDFPISESELRIINGKADWEYPKSLNKKRIHLEINNQSLNHDLVIIEGLFCYSEELKYPMDFKIFVEISKHTFIQRKKSDLRWGASPEPPWYMDHIWESYLYYGRPSLNMEYFCVNGSHLFKIDEISSDILKKYYSWLST